MAEKQTFQNRIIGHGQKAASEFQFNPLNWRRHPDSQRSALTSVLSSIGWVTGVIENERTGNLIDGHARIEQALKEGDATQVPYTKVDLSEAEEKQMLLLLDPIGGMATTDEDMIRSLMEIVGLEDESLLDVLTSITALELGGAEEDGPNLNDPNFNYQSQYGVIVTCENEKHQQKVFNELTAQGYAVKVVVV